MSSSKSKADRKGQLDRIRALMARTVAAGCTEAEAKEAAFAVDRLLSLYEIDLDEVTVKEQEIVSIMVAGGNHVVGFAARKIAAFTDCRVWTFERAKLVYFGFEVDTQIAEYLTAVFLRAIDRESQAFTMFNSDYDEKTSRGQSDMIESFGIGMAGRLGERLDELKSKRDFVKRTTGMDLVKVKGPLVDAAFDALGLVMGRGGRGRSVRDPSAFAAGRTAAGNVSINQGIAGRGQVGGRLK
jgi:hypothetical protein